MVALKRTHPKANQSTVPWFKIMDRPEFLELMGTKWGLFSGTMNPEIVYVQS